MAGSQLAEVLHLFWKQKYEQLQFALTYNAPSSFLLLTSKVLRFQRRLRFCFPRWSRLAWSPCPPIPRGLVVQLLTLRGQRLRVTDRLPAMAVMKSRLHHASEHAETGITSSL